MHIAAFYELQPFMNWRDDINIWWFINHFLWLNGRSGNTAGLALCPYMEFQCSKLSKTTTCRGAHSELDDYNTVFLKRKLWVLISMKTLNWLHSGACSFILQACSGCCWGAAGVLCCPWGVGRLWIRMLQGNSRGTDTETLTKGAGGDLDIFYRTASDVVTTAELTHAPTCKGTWKWPKVCL